MGRSQNDSEAMSPMRAAIPASLEDGLPRGLPAAVGAVAAAADVSDAELVGRALAEDQDAFAALVARYQRKAFWIAFHVLGRVEDSRDVAQEAFVRVYRSLAKFDFARNFYTWFYRIVMNLAIDHLRKHKTVRAARLDDFGDSLPGELETTAPAEQRETTGMVWRVLDRMDAKFKSVLVLRDIHGMSCREIAPILQVTHATVRWRLHRGRQIFKEHWERLAKGEEA